MKNQSIDPIIKTFILQDSNYALEIAKRELARGKFGNVPNKFMLGEIKLEDYFSYDIIEKINNAQKNDRIYLYGSPQQNHYCLYYICLEELSQLNDSINFWIKRTSENVQSYKNQIWVCKEHINKYKKQKSLLLKKFSKIEKVKAK